MAEPGDARMMAASPAEGLGPATGPLRTAMVGLLVGRPYGNVCNQALMLRCAHSAGLEMPAPVDGIFEVQLDVQPRIRATRGS